MKRLNVFGVALAVMMGAGVSHGALFDDWSRSMKITFNGYSRPEPLTNFPALVTLGESVRGFRYADFQSGGYNDLRFTDSSQTTELVYEVESWDTGGVSYVWVQVPELVTSNTAIWAYWGKASTDAPAHTTNGATWADGYKVVYHMNQTNAAGAMPDSLKGSTGVVFSVTNAPGRVAGAFAFNGTNAMVDCGDVNSVDGLSRVTMELWVKPKTNSLPIQKSFFRKDSVLGLDGGSTARRPRGLFASAGWKLPEGSTVVDDGNWHHLMGVFDGAFCRLYVDGLPDGTPRAATAALAANANVLTVGWSVAGPAIYYEGLMDEMRIAGVSRSSNWVWATWMNQASNATFAAGEIGVATVQVTSASGLAPESTTLGGTLVSTGWSETVATVFWGTSDGGQNAGAWAFTNILPGFQAPGPFSVTVSNLLTNQVYFYTFQASNRFGYGMATSSATFKTMGPPVCDNASGATSIGYTNAILRGTLLEGSTAYASIWWGSDSGNLTNGTGPQWVSEGVFTETLSGLQNDATYYYRCFVSNDYGTNWAGAVTNFTTPVKGIVWSGAGATNSFLASNPTNWLGGVCPTNGTAVCLDGTTNKSMTWDLSNVTVRAWNQDTGYTGTVTFPTKFPAGGGFRQFEITGNCKILDGAWTHLANGGNAAEHDRLSVKIGGDLILGPTGAINVDQKGFTQAQGPSAGGTTTGSSGAGHGGQASIGISLLPIGPTYGSVYYPTNLGSAAYVRGGGAVLLEVGGNAHLDGVITAAGTGGNRAGSAGGSILIRAYSISGTGTVSAAGGYGVSPGGAGGGGRVAVILAGGTSFGSVACRAFGATGEVCPSGAGTVYLQKAGQTEGGGTLIVDNGNLTPHNPMGTCTLIPDAGSRNGDHTLSGLEAIVIRNRGILGINTNTAIDFGAVSILGDGASVVANWRTASSMPPGAVIALRGTNRVVFPNPFVISNYSLCVDIPMSVAGDWRVASNGSLSHSGNYDPVPGAETFRLRLDLAGNLTVEAGGAIEANTKGYYVWKGPSPAATATGQNQKGASHGGKGAQSSSGVALPSGGYGLVRAPRTLGSGGSRYSTGYTPRSGGGSIEITVRGTTTVYGVVSVRPGMPGEYRSAGAAGGSIYLQTRALQGTGSIEARGDSSGADNSSPGGGGRIAVGLTESESFGEVAMSAAGVTGGANPSGPGTLYRERASETGGRGTLLIDNAGIAINGTNTHAQLPAAAYASADELAPVTLAITNRGQVALTTNLAMRNLYVYTNCILYLKGYTLTLASAYHADWGSTNWVVYEGGQIVWGGRRGGTVIMVR